MNFAFLKYIHMNYAFLKYIHIKFIYAWKYSLHNIFKSVFIKKQYFFCIVN